LERSREFALTATRSLGKKESCLWKTRGEGEVLARKITRGDAGRFGQQENRSDWASIERLDTVVGFAKGVFVGFASFGGFGVSIVFFEVCGIPVSIATMEWSGGANASSARMVSTHSSMAFL
jgi:hypothetical protein